MLIVVVVPLTVRLFVTTTLLEKVLLPAIDWSPEVITAPAERILAVSVTSAFSSIPSNLVLRVSVKLFCVNPPSPTV